MSLSGNPSGVAMNLVPMEPKYCEKCSRVFYRLIQLGNHKTLATGEVIDLNCYCPSCEHKMMAAAKEHRLDCIRFRLDMTVESRAHEQWTERDVSKLRRRIEGECIRKEVFFDYIIALRAAKRSRHAHRGDRPCQVYKCHHKINPEMFPDYADRAKTHWHLGGIKGKS